MLNMNKEITLPLTEFVTIGKELMGFAQLELFATGVHGDIAKVASLQDRVHPGRIQITC